MPNSSNKPSPKFQKILKIAALIIFIAAAISLFVFFDVGELVRIEFLRQQVDSFGVFAPLFFIALYMIATIFFLPGTPLSIASGVLFGAFFGAIYTLIGATLGASIAFLFSRYVGRNAVDGFLKNNTKKIVRYDEELKQHGFFVVLFLRLIPLFPFNGLNFGLGLTKVKFKDYFLGTAVGIAPAVFIFAYFGNSLASPKLFQILLAIGLLGLLITAPIVYKKQRQKQGKPLMPAFLKKEKSHETKK